MKVAITLCEYKLAAIWIATRLNESMITNIVASHCINVLKRIIALSFMVLEKPGLI
jgi:hypothetical protein